MNICKICNKEVNGNTCEYCGFEINPIKKRVYDVIAMSVAIITFAVCVGAFW